MIQVVQWKHCYSFHNETMKQCFQVDEWKHCYYPLNNQTMKQCFKLLKALLLSFSQSNYETGACFQARVIINQQACTMHRTMNVTCEEGGAHAELQTRSIYLAHLTSMQSHRDTTIRMSKHSNSVIWVSVWVVCHKWLADYCLCYTPH